MNEQSENLAKTYVRSTSIGWLRIALVRGSQIIYLVFMARWLTLAEQGFVQSVALGINLVAGIVTMWIAWVMKQKALSETDPAKKDELVHQLTVYGVILSLTIAPLFALLYVSFTPGIGVGEAGILLTLVTTVMCLNVIGEAIYVSFLKIERTLIIGAGRLVLNYAIPFALFFLTNNVITIFWGWLIADLISITILFTTAGLKRKRRLFRLQIPSKELIIFALPILIIYILRSLRFFIDRYIVLIFMGGAEFAVYHLVSRITQISSDAVLTLLIAFFPIMTVVFAKRQQKIGVALGATLKMLIHAIIFVVPILIFFGAPIIAFLLGPQYISLESTIILTIASFGMSFLALTHIFFRTKEAKGAVRILVLFEFLFVGGQILFLIIFLYNGWLTLYGSIAVALSVALGNLLALIVMAFKTEELKLIDWGSLLRTIFLCVPITVIVYFLSLILAPQDLLDVFIVAGISVLSLIALSGVLSCFTNEDLKIIIRAARRFEPLIRFYRKLAIRKEEGTKEVQQND